MTFGLQMFDESGNLSVDSLTYSMRTIYSVYVAGGSFSGTRSYYVPGSASCLVFLSPAAGNQFNLGVPQILSRSGDTIVISNQTRLQNVIASYLYVVAIS